MIQRIYVDYIHTLASGKDGNMQYANLCDIQYGASATMHVFWL